MAEPKTTLYLAASRGIRPREVPQKRSHSYKVLCVNKSSDEFNQTLLREYKRFGYELMLLMKEQIFFRGATKCIVHIIKIKNLLRLKFID